MEVYITINEWCCATESGYDIMEVLDNEEDALQSIATTHMDFIRDCDHNEFIDFEDYDVEYGDDGRAITIRSRKDANLYERFYIVSRTI